MSNDVDIFRLTRECVSDDLEVRFVARQRFQDLYGDEIYRWIQVVPKLLYRRLPPDEVHDFYLYIIKERLFLRIAKFRGDGGCPFEAYLKIVLKGLFRDWLRARRPEEQAESYDQLTESGREKELAEDTDLSAEESLGAKSEANHILGPPGDMEGVEDPSFSAGSEEESETEDHDLSVQDLGLTTDTPEENEDKERVGVYEQLASLAPYEQLLIKLRILFWYDPTPEDIALLAEISSQSEDEVRAVLATVKAKLALKDEEASGLQVKLAEITSHIRREEKRIQESQAQLQKIDEGIRPFLHVEVRKMDDESDMKQSHGAYVERVMAQRTELQKALVKQEKTVTKLDKQRAKVLQELRQKKLRPSVEDVQELLQKPWRTIESRTCRIIQRLRRDQEGGVIEEGAIQ